MERIATARITLSELPARTRRLSDVELHDVFGGCLGHGRGCANNSDCCSGVCDVSGGYTEVLWVAKFGSCS